MHFIVFGNIGISTARGRGRGGLLGSSFAGYVPLASQNTFFFFILEFIQKYCNCSVIEKKKQQPNPIIVYSVASYRPHLSHFWANVIVISRTEFNASRLLNIKTTAGTIFQPRI